MAKKELRRPRTLAVAPALKVVDSQRAADFEVRSFCPFCGGSDATLERPCCKEWLEAIAMPGAESPSQPAPEAVFAPPPVVPDVSPPPALPIVSSLPAPARARIASKSSRFAFGARILGQPSQLLVALLAASIAGLGISLASQFRIAVERRDAVQPSPYLGSGTVPIGETVSTELALASPSISSSVETSLAAVAPLSGLPAPLQVAGAPERPAGVEAAEQAEPVAAPGAPQAPAAGAAGATSPAAQGRAATSEPPTALTRAAMSVPGVLPPPRREAPIASPQEAEEVLSRFAQSPQELALIARIKSKSTLETPQRTAALDGMLSFLSPSPSASNETAGKWRMLRRGMGREAVRAILGNPPLVENSVNTEFWLYREETILGRGWVAFSDGEGKLFSWREP